MNIFKPRPLFPLCLLFLFSAMSTFAQSASPKPCVVPAGFLCITQDAGNVAKSEHNELLASREAISSLKEQLIEKDKIAEGIRATATKNENDLKAAIHDADVKMATATGQVIECRADKTMYTSLIEFLAKNQRSKQQGLINIKLGGN